MSANPPGSVWRSTPRALRTLLPVPVPMTREDAALLAAEATELGAGRADYLRALLTVGRAHPDEVRAALPPAPSASAPARRRRAKPRPPA